MRRRSPRVIRLSAEAQARWVTWYDQHTAGMAGDDFQRRLRGPWAKLPGQLARLTLILHAIVSTPVTADVHPGTLEAAVVLLDTSKATLGGHIASSPGAAGIVWWCCCRR